MNKIHTHLQLRTEILQIINNDENFLLSLQTVALLVQDIFKKRSNKVLVCGNGGSAAESQHFSAELVCKFKKERAHLPAINLAADSSIMSAVSNDYSFHDVFAYQIEAYGQKGDVLFGLSTSALSQNVIKAFQQAKKQNLITISLTGQVDEENLLYQLSDYNIAVPSSHTAIIQEVHLMAIHVICSYIDEIF